MAFSDVTAMLNAIQSTLDSLVNGLEVSAQAAGVGQSAALLTHIEAVKKRIATIKRLAATVQSLPLETARQYKRQDDLEVEGRGRLTDNRLVTGRYKCNELFYATNNPGIGHNNNPSPGWALKYQRNGSGCSSIPNQHNFPDWREGDPMKEQTNNCVADVGRLKGWRLTKKP
jgi:hypothetical protein